MTQTEAQRTEAQRFEKYKAAIMQDWRNKESAVCLLTFGELLEILRRLEL